MPYVSTKDSKWDYARESHRKSFEKKMEALETIAQDRDELYKLFKDMSDKICELEIQNTAYFGKEEEAWTYYKAQDKNYRPSECESGLVYEVTKQECVSSGSLQGGPVIFRYPVTKCKNLLQFVQCCHPDTMNGYYGDEPVGRIIDPGLLGKKGKMGRTLVKVENVYVWPDEDDFEYTGLNTGEWGIGFTMGNYRKVTSKLGKKKLYKVPYESDNVQALGVIRMLLRNHSQNSGNDYSI